jgi:hypothetical protein
MTRERARWIRASVAGAVDVVITFGANGSQPLLLPTLSGNALS